MPSRLLYNVTDYRGKDATTTLHGPDLDGTNYDVQFALVTGIRAALEDIVLGKVTGEQLISSVLEPENPPATSPYAKRQLKLLFGYVDNVTGEAYTFTVGAPDLSALVIPQNSDDVTLADLSNMAAFVSAVEAFALSKDGNAITIQSCRIVGRNL